MPKEIERRFAPMDLPTGLVLHPPDQIEQIYTFIDEEKALEERVRYRLTPNGDLNYTRYRKQGAGRDRLETATPISAIEYLDAVVSGIGKPIKKVVYHERWENTWLELHVFLSHRFVTIEVEFSDESMAERFIPPTWFGREVTDDGRYNSAGIARHGVPTDYTMGDHLSRRFYGPSPSA